MAIFFDLILNYLIVINISWIAIFIVAIRSNYLIPAVDLGLKIARQAISLSSSLSCTDLSNNSLPFVSIIVPARNEEKNIKKCLLTLLNQSYANSEVIAIDDNSTDNTLQIMNEIKNDKRILESASKSGKLKVLSLTSKPEGWTGKAWASEQGYLESQGDVLLFTDADTCFFNKDTILLAVWYLQNETLDVLTGHAKIDLPDFWSKITIPLWDYFSIILGQNPVAVNNANSNEAYLVGSFFMMRKKVLKMVDRFHSVRAAIKEDVELGLQIKRDGFNMKIVKMDKLYSALWSRDLLTLWHGIARTLSPMSKSRVIANLVSLFFLAVVPFLILPYTLSSSLEIAIQHNKIIFNHLTSSIIPILNISSCLMIVIGPAIKNIKKYNINAAYSLLTFPAALFLVSAYFAIMIPLFMSFKRSKILKVQWRHRTYIYKKEGLIVKSSKVCEIHGHADKTEN
jgi:chlorobactene glucosyltransferase